MVRLQMKAPTLADLSRKRPTFEELLTVFQLLETESDRGCALIAGAWLENLLQMAIDCHFADCGPDFRQRLYEGSGAPLGTFAAKIKIGRALSIYDAGIQKRFEKVKDIRNAFAHALRPLDFANPTIVSACTGLDKAPFPQEEDNLKPARIRYTAFCYAWGQKLFEVANEVGGREMDVKLSIQDPPPQAQS